MKRIIFGWSAIIWMLLVASLSPAAERPYYQGKTVTFFINFSAGGPTDIEGRIVARHLARHVPGNPTILVQNMSGAGGVTGINFLGERSKPDGLTLGYFTGPYNHQMMKSSTLRIDLMKVPSVTFAPMWRRASSGRRISSRPSAFAPAACPSIATKIYAFAWPSMFSASSTITSPATTAATTPGWRCSATRSSIMTKIFPATAAWSNRRWSRPAW
jgi:hypothetical protein